MNRETISDALGGIDAKYIEEAADEPARARGRWSRTLLPLAACAALIVTAALTLPSLPWAAESDCAAAGSSLDQNTQLPHPEAGSPAPDSDSTPGDWAEGGLKDGPLQINPGPQPDWAVGLEQSLSPEPAPVDRAALLACYGVELPVPELLPQLHPVDSPSWSLDRAINFFPFVSADGTQQLSIGLSKASAPMEPPQADLRLTPVNGRALAVFSPAAGRLYTQWEQQGLHWYLSGDGVSPQDFYTILTHFVQSEDTQPSSTKGE